MAHHLRRWMAIAALLLGIAFIAPGFYLTQPKSVGLTHFSPSTTQTMALTNGTRFSTPAGCSSNATLSAPVYIISPAQANQLLTVRVGDQVAVSDEQVTPLFGSESSLCLVQWSNPGGYQYLADRTGTTTVYFGQSGARVSVVEVKVVPSWNRLPGLLLMGLGAVSLVFGLYVFSETRRPPGDSDLRRADDAQTGGLSPNYGERGEAAVIRNFPGY